MKTAVRIGVAGCGFYAANHLHAWRHLAGEGAALAAVCDVDAAKAKLAGEAFGVPWFHSADAMLAAVTLDVVDIVTRQDTHRAIAEAVFARNVGAIVQKPFAPSWDDCIAIIEMAKRHGVFLAVHENFRFQTPMRQVRRVIDSGAIGTPNWARIAFRTGFDVFERQPYLEHEARLAIADVGVHMLDLTRFLVGEVELISCQTQQRRSGISGEDTATMLLRHLSGAVSVVECTYQAKRIPDPFPQTLIEIEGDQGSIAVAPGCAMTVTSGNLVWTQDISAPLLPWTSHPWHVSQEGVLGACRHFLHCLKSGQAPETTGGDNLRTYALVEAAYEAAATSAFVRPRMRGDAAAVGGSS